MLSTLRSATQSIFAKILLLLLVASFAVWGVSGVFVAGAGNATVEFGKTSVSLLDHRLAYDLQVNNLSRQLGQRITREQARSFGIEQSVLGQVIAGAVLDENARQMGMSVSNDELASMIGDDPAFRDSTGRFSRLTLENVLRQVGMREDDYLRNRKAVAVRRQFADAIADNVAPPIAFFDAFGAYQAQKRVFEYVTVDTSAVTDKPVPSDSDVETWYEDHKNDYLAPEYRKIALVRLTAEDISQPDLIDEAAVKENYEADKARFTTEERRHVQQLVFTDQTAAESALKRIREGELFDTIATEAGRTTADIDLGTVTKKQIPDVNVADAAFGLELNAVSDVVNGIFGPVLLRVTEIAPEQVKPLAEVEEEIRNKLALDKATDDLYDVHDRLEDERAAGELLEQAAKNVGLKTRIVDAVDSSGKAPDGSEVKDIPEQASLLTQAFQTEPEVETDPIPIGSAGFVWYEVRDVTPERQKPLEEVRDDVVAAWTEDAISKKVAEIADTIRDRAEKGESLAAVAAELLPANADGTPATTKTSVELTRNDANDELVRTAVTAAFSVPKGATTAAPGAEAPSRVVLKVIDVIDAEPESTPDTVRQQVDNAVSEDLVSALISDFQSRDQVRINERAIDAALTF
ncbi:MAG: SurA N-terminal domain-containing protein [Nitratireductor sp.]|nr:SurA N-terminal domain-containing protein [Nitratireductor sp.]